MAGQNQGGGNVDLFDAYFRRADLDQDGRISGDEAVSFFQASNLSKQVLAQHEVAHEGETGKVSRADFRDRSGRSVLIMRPGMQNTKSAAGNIRHLVYLLENAILNLPEGQGQMSWLIDFNGWTLNTHISIKTSRDIIYVLQNHYPERLAIVVIYNPPKFFEAFWKEGSDAVSVALGVAAATGLSLLAYTEVGCKYF